MSASATMEDLRHLRVDQVGGLGVPSALRRVRRLQARRSRREEFGRAKDEAIRHVIAKQEAIGFPILTDGELRRRNFQESFSESVSGFEVPAEDKSMEGVTCSRWSAPSRISPRPARRFGHGAASSSGCG